MSSPLYKEVLTSELTAFFPLLAGFKKDFYLAGGTALALLIGHKISVDFDLFSNEPIKKTLLTEAEKVWRGGLSVVVNNRDELTFLKSGTKVTFLHYPFPPQLPLVNGEYVNLLSAKEILATKAYTIGRRGAYKDYVDMYAGLQQGVASLFDIITLANKKYGDGFNDRLFLEQLLYLDDIEDQDVMMKDGDVPSREDIIALFTEVISEVNLN